MNTQQGIVTGIFLGNGGGGYSRVWVRTVDADYNFDVHGLTTAQRLKPGQQIQIQVINGKAQPA